MPKTSDRAEVPAAVHTRIAAILDAAYAAHTAIKLILENHSRTFTRKQRLGSPSSRPTGSNSPQRPSTAPGSISSTASFPSLPAPSCATSGRTETATQGARIIIAIDEFNR